MFLLCIAFSEVGELNNLLTNPNADLDLAEVDRFLKLYKKRVPV